MEENDRVLLLRIEGKIDKFLALLEELQPMLDRYRAAANAGSVLKARKVFKG